MEFRTKVTVPKAKRQLTHRSAILMLGSCFSDSIALRLRRRLFDVESNPFGALYNPASIHNAIERAVSNRRFTPDEMFQRDGRFYCFDSHTAISATDPLQLCDVLNGRFDSLQSYLAKADAIFLTFGTAWIFQHLESEHIVANCHKLPASQFRRRRLTLAETSRLIGDTIQMIRQFNPTTQIWLTVSPIRHLADGAHDNQISKSTLIMATAEAVENAPTDTVGYFPSYEIILDDLRDYRFYAPDMTHPSDQAADYVFEQFSSAFFSEKTVAESCKYEKVVRLLSHRPMTNDPEKLSELRAKTESVTAALIAEHPYLSRPINLIRNELLNN